MRHVFIALLLLFITLNLSGQSDFVQLLENFDQNVEWIDHSGSQFISKRQGSKNFKRILKTFNHKDIALRHKSKWQNGQCYKIYHLRSDQSNDLRVFVQCTKNDNSEMKVTRVRVTAI